MLRAMPSSSPRSSAKPFNRPMNITVRYKLQIEGQGTKLVRQKIHTEEKVTTKDGETTTVARDEDFVIAPPKKDGQDVKLTVPDIGLREKLKKRMEKLFEPEIVNQDNIANGLELPGKWKKAGRLAVKQADSKGGWLVYGWEPAAVEKVASKKLAAVDSPQSQPTGP